MNYLFETERLRFRDMRADDAEILFELNSDPEVVRYTGDGAFESIEATRKFIGERLKQYTLDGYGRWIAALKDSGEIVGWCGLKKHANGSTDVGYRFFRRHWGKGFGTESCKASLDRGFSVHHLAIIYAEARVENIPSIRIMQKCGMKFAFNHKGCDGDTVVYEIVRP
ncbi:MAG TPA: GNAT family N-acetyltransferase [Bacteroidia bacterium]|jgi:RimJ/RimL family protein N-acetyltransferase|nr:GNAT family N-acetyltransferase [Bacteroidia bacterium]